MHALNPHHHARLAGPSKGPPAKSSRELHVNKTMIFENSCRLCLSQEGKIGHTLCCVIDSPTKATRTLSPREITLAKSNAIASQQQNQSSETMKDKTWHVHSGIFSYLSTFKCFQRKRQCFAACFESRLASQSLPLDQLSPSLHWVRLIIVHVVET